MFHYTITFLLLLNLTIVADSNLSTRLYQGADEIIRMDEKMNRAIAEHNQFNGEIRPMEIEDFKDLNGAYLLSKTIPNPSKTKIEVEVKNGLLIIYTTTQEQEQVQNEFNRTVTTTISTSETSLFIPHDADIESMQKRYDHGILEIQFSKK